MTDVPVARVVVPCIAKRCLVERHREKYEVAVIPPRRTAAQWFIVSKELWETTRLDWPIPVEALQ